MYFHARFSTNTEPHPMMAQPFRLMAHNGELNTDRKNRISDETLAITRHRRIVRRLCCSLLDDARVDVAALPTSSLELYDTADRRVALISQV